MPRISGIFWKEATSLLPTKMRLQSTMTKEFYVKTDIHYGLPRNFLVRRSKTSSQPSLLLPKNATPVRQISLFIVLEISQTSDVPCSATDNPLVDGETGEVHHGGNFQAMAITNAMEKTRLALHHIGKLLFSQSTELVNPLMNRGLPPSLAATDPSLNYHVKGIDIATAAYVGELGYLANPVSTHIQSAEMHNQAIKYVPAHRSF